MQNVRKTEKKQSKKIIIIFIIMAAVAIFAFKDELFSAAYGGQSPLINESAVAVANADKNQKLPILINKEHLLPADYQVNLVKVKGSTIQVDRSIVTQLESMVREAKKNGIIIQFNSGYRTPESATKIYNDKVNEFLTAGLTKAEAEKKARALVAPPFASEHNAGLAVDLEATGGKGIEWVFENAHRFGFILRYPQDKVDITDISYEPWHFRYVGSTHATVMFKKNLCLEEYIEEQNANPAR